MWGSSRHSKRYSENPECDEEGFDSASSLILSSLGRTLKWFDTYRVNSYVATSSTGAGGDFDPTGGVDCISCPPQGDGLSERDGRRIVIRSIHVKGEMITSTAITPLTPALNYRSSVFVAIVLDKQTNGVQCRSEDVFTCPHGILAAYPFPNPLYEDRFEVLHHEVMQLDPTPITGIIEEVATFGVTTSVFSLCVTKDFDICLDDLSIPVTFKDAAAQVSSVVDNSIHIICYTQSIWFLIDGSYHARIRYHD